jgi:hypothetical protein
MIIDNKNSDTQKKVCTVERKPDYEKAELDMLLSALKRTHMERFLYATKWYKIQQTLKKATITHQP